MMFSIAMYIVVGGWTTLPPWNCCYLLFILWKWWNPTTQAQHQPFSVHRPHTRKFAKDLAASEGGQAKPLLKASVSSQPVTWGSTECCTNISTSIKPHSWARLPKELDIPNQSHRVMPRSKHVSYGCYPCSWGCACALQTQVSTYSAGSSSWKVWTIRCKSLGAHITTCSGENSSFKNRHADYISSFLISWRVKAPSVNVRALCLLKA